MATNFPSSLDNFTNPVSGNTLDSPSHSLQHSDANDAIEAIEAKLGVGNSPAGSATAGQVLTISAAGTSAWTTPAVLGLAQIIPTSVTVGSGSGSVSATGGVTFSGASSVTINSCFNATYENYLILLDHTTSGGGNLNLQFTSAGTPNSTTGNYRFSGFYSVYTSATLNGSNSSTSWGQFIVGASGATNNSYAVIEIGGPFSSTRNTSLLVQDQRSDYGYEVRGGALTVTTSYDGIKLFSDAGNISGNCRIYGYRN